MHVSPALEYIYACLRAAGWPSGCFIVTGITDCARSGCTILHPTGDARGPRSPQPRQLPRHPPSSLPLTALPALALGEQHELRVVGDAPEVISSELRAIFVETQAGARNRQLGQGGGASRAGRLLTACQAGPPCSNKHQVFAPAARTGNKNRL